ncbi:ATP-binding protein [Desulfovibrio sp.]|uniref:ATP-binding protein n=1 Tax=Desulfovibrio sp. TaxID=885 RepID=UPI0025BA79EF|nr:ATP-binding protein [Desulfovibrio sp.]
MSHISRISGAVGPKVLVKADQLFNSSDETIIAELLQNCRRAGATAVDISLVPVEDGVAVTIRDNGKGIDDFQALVTFGGSNWDERTDVMENAAGMGFYSLATRGVTVRSAGFTVRLTKAVFLGQEDAPVVPDTDPVVSGTVLHYVTGGQGRGEADLRQVIQNAVLYYPVAVTINGVPVTQRSLSDGAIKTVHWRGCNIHVFKDKCPVGSTNGLWSGYFKGLINYHGHLVRSLPDGQKFSVVQVHGSPLFAVIDVVDTADLQLVLPTRDQVIRNAFYDELTTEARRALFGVIAEAGRHSLSHNLWMEAQALGIQLPEATFFLNGWTPRDEDGSRWGGARDVVVAAGANIAVCDLERVQDHVLSQLLESKPADLALYTDEIGYHGYPSYDRFRHIVGFRHTISVNEKKTELLDCGDFDRMSLPAGLEVADAIETEVCVQVPAEVDGDIATLWQGPVQVIIEDEEDICDASYVVRQTADPGQVVDILMDALFSYSDDGDAGSHDEQRSGAYEDARDKVMKRLRGQTEADVSSLLAGLEEIRWRFRFSEFKSLNIRQVHAKTDGMPASLRVELRLADGTKRAAAL